MKLLGRYLAGPACIVLMATFILTGCGGGGSSDTQENGSLDPAPERQWTYMVYMAADNNLSSAAEDDINEMEEVGSGDDVNIVVQVEFSDIYDSETLRSRITGDEDEGDMSSEFTNIGRQDMTDPQTLTDFVAWAAEYYPAQHYALTLWSHGSGWKMPSISSAVYKGVITDDTDNPNELMTLAQLASAVDSSGIDLGLINFDTCLMGMYEVAYELGGLADYLVFSEESYPSDGDAYDDILQELTNDPDMGADVLAETITSVCKDYYEDYYERVEGYMTKSAVDMVYIGNLHEGLCFLAEVMIDNMDTEGTHIRTARDDSVSYNYPENHDLGNFLEKLEENTGDGDMITAIRQVQGALSNLVISNEVFSSVPGDDIGDSQGIAIYLPARNQIAPDDLDDYAALTCNQSDFTTVWGNFVEALVSYETSTFP